MLQRVDDFLIDRAFQPMSDALARWISCYGAAEFLWTSAIMARLVLLVHDQDRYWIATLLLVPGMLAFLVDCRQEDMKAPSAILPEFRVRYVVIRYTGIALAPVDTLSLVAGDNWSDRLQSLSWFAVYAACWFMACRRNPPKPSLAPMAINAKAATP